MLKKLKKSKFYQITAQICDDKMLKNYSITTKNYAATYR